MPTRFPILDRFRPLLWLAGCLLAISAATRLALLVVTGSGGYVACLTR